MLTEQREARSGCLGWPGMGLSPPRAGKREGRPENPAHSDSCPTAPVPGLGTHSWLQDGARTGSYSRGCSLGCFACGQLLALLLQRHWVGSLHTPALASSSTLPLDLRCASVWPRTCPAGDLTRAHPRRSLCARPGVLDKAAKASPFPVPQRGFSKGAQFLLCRWSLLRAQIPL